MTREYAAFEAEIKKRDEAWARRLGDMEARAEKAERPEASHE